MIRFSNTLLRVCRSYTGIACLLIMFPVWVGCDVTIVPMSDSDKAYSVSGTLNLQSTPNFIRVHDTGSLLNPESTKELDLQVVFTNLTTMESRLLRDSVVVFDNIYTHNYVVDIPLEFDTRYKIEIEDGEGFRDSLVSVTTRESNLSVTPATVDSCTKYFFIELSDIDLDAGERVDMEVAINVANTWHWTSRRDFFQYDSDKIEIVVGWSPRSISLLLWPNNPVPCEQFSSNMIRFRFTHIGYVEGGDGENQTEFTRSSVKRMNVFSKYSGEAEILIADEVFE
jgi:hypothetical protein